MNYAGGFVVQKLVDCPGCARRREAIRDFSRKMADWIRRPNDVPLDPIPPRIAPWPARDEAMDRIRKLLSSDKT